MTATEPEAEGLRLTLQEAENPSLIGISFPRSKKGFGIYQHTVTREQYLRFQDLKAAHVRRKDAA